MIKIKTKYNYEADMLETLKVKYKDSSAIEILSLIHELIKDIQEAENISKEEVYKYIKMQDDDEIEVL